MGERHQRGESMPDRDRRCGEPEPRVWLVLGEKPGDNAQIRNLAAAVGWSFKEKKVVVRPRWQLAKPWVRPSLDHIDRARSDDLSPPWPDLVITAGRRLYCVGLWIKRASEGRSKLVMVGRPRRRLDRVDLVVAASHYRISNGTKVARHDLPMMHADERVLEHAATSWQERLASMPRPLTALFMGGPTGGLRFDLEVARDLVERTLAEARASGGSLYISTSRRTPPEIVDVLRRELPADVRLFAFDPSVDPAENPYHALLALADHFVVTTDSISMMVEVVRLGRPLSLYPLESEIGVFERMLERLGLVRPLSPRSDPLPAGGLHARMMYRLGRPVHSRDLSAIPRLLVAQERAVWLGDPRQEPVPFAEDDLDAVAARIRSLVPRTAPADEQSGALRAMAGQAARKPGVQGSRRRM